MCQPTIGGPGWFVDESVPCFLICHGLPLNMATQMAIVGKPSLIFPEWDPDT
jgi:hypothetical protein